MTEARALSLYGFQSPSAPRLARTRHLSPPLPAAVAEQVKVSFYAPVLAGTNLAEGLLRAAQADAAQMKEAEWRATMQQAMEQIRASCAALQDISVSEAGHEAFPPILGSVDELERFLRLATPLVGDLAPDVQRHQLDLSMNALAQAVGGLKRIDKSILHPASARPAAKKHPASRSPRRRSVEIEKPANRPGWLEALMPKHKPKKPQPVPVEPQPTTPSPKPMTAPVAAPPSEPPSRLMMDGLKLLSSSGQWIEQTVEHDVNLKSESIRREYIADLYVFNAWRRERPFTRALIEEYTESLEQTGYSPAAVEQMLQALHWLASRLAEMVTENHHLDAAEQQDILISAAQVLGFRQPRAAVPSPEPLIAQAELTALLHNCAQDSAWLGIRDAAIIALAWTANLKPSQLASLKVASFRSENGEGSLIVRRGLKDDAIPLPGPATQAILKWLSVRRYNLGPMFYAINREGDIRWGHAMMERDIAQVIERRMLAAQIASSVRPNEG